MADSREIQKEINPELFETDDQSPHDGAISSREGEQASMQIEPVLGSAPKYIGGKYRVLELLGKGGMGAVYKVHHIALDKVYAAKVLNSDVTTDFKILQRFDQEAKSIGTLNHPNLIAVHDYGTSDDGTPYLIMDFLDGHSLDEELKTNGPLEEKHALHIFGLVCDALKHAHDKGIIHRDIKPSNIMLVKTEEGKEGVKIVDFGIAKRELIDNKVTQTGEVFGTPLYMSPEQCLGKPCDSRSDIYSLGCVIYEALTGIVPFAADNAVQTIFNHLNITPPPLRKANPGCKLSLSIEQIVAACLEKEPKDRIESAEVVAINLRRIESGQSPVLNSKLLRLKKGTAFKLGNMITFFLACLFVLIAGFVILGIVKDSRPSMKLATQGVQQFEKADYLKATTSFEEGLKIARTEKESKFDQIKFLEYLTNCYSYTHNYQKAEIASRELAQIHMKDNEFIAADRYSNLAWRYMSKVDKNKELEALNFAIQVREKAFGVDSPELFEQVQHRAGDYYAIGDTKNAVQDAERALKLATANPTKIDNQNKFIQSKLLSSYLMRAGENKRALEVINEALSSTSGVSTNYVSALQGRRKKLLESMSKNHPADRKK